MNIFSNSLIFLLINSMVFFGSILHNKYVLGAVKIINDNIIISNKLLFLQSYFYTWTTFIAYNLYLSLFHCDNFLIVEDNVFYLIFCIIIHFIVLIICAIYEVGFHRVRSSIYKTPEIINTSQILLASIICFSNILSYFIIKPLSIICRIILNIKIGEIFNDMLIGTRFEHIISSSIKLIKIPMYFMQIYIIVLLSKKFYSHLVEDH